MSIQTLLHDNNYKLFCDEIVTNDIISSTFVQDDYNINYVTAGSVIESVANTTLQLTDFIDVEGNLNGFDANSGVFDPASIEEAGYYHVQISVINPTSFGGGTCNGTIFILDETNAVIWGQDVDLSIKTGFNAYATFSLNILCGLNLPTTKFSFGIRLSAVAELNIEFNIFKIYAV